MKVSVLFVFLLFTLGLAAQANLKNDDFKLLMLNKEAIRKDSIVNEKIVDLVKVFTIDSVFERATERHRPIGPMIQWFGYRWESINQSREKLVGTCKKDIHGTGKEHFTEFDVNMDLVAHLPKYIALTESGYAKQIKLDRNLKDKNLNEAPFIKSTPTTQQAYRVHCENTPYKPMRQSIGNWVYPCLEPRSFVTHPNFGEAYPTVGVYGPFVSDCNHSCSPEIHPYEFFWWMNLNPNEVQTTNRTEWVFALTRDYSNRFQHWSSSPRTGQISFPFVLPLNRDTLYIDFEPLIWDKMMNEQLTQLNLPENAASVNSGTKIYEIQTPAGTKYIRFQSSKLIPDEGIKYYISNANLIEDHTLLTAYVNFGLSVANFFSSKVIFSY